MDNINIEDVLEKLLLPGYQVKDIVRIKLIPIKEREVDGAEIKIVNSFGETFLIKRDQLSTSGYTHSNGNEIKFNRLTSKSDVFGFRDCNEPMKALYVAKGHPITLDGTEVEDKYIISIGGKTKICSKVPFRKMFTIDRSEKYTFAKEIAQEKKIPLVYQLSNRVEKQSVIVGYLLVNNKTDKIDSMTVEQVMDLAERGMVKDVSVKSTSRGRKLCGKGLDNIN